jgi:hypothetical protein
MVDIDFTDLGFVVAMLADDFLETIFPVLNVPAIVRGH